MSEKLFKDDNIERLGSFVDNHLSKNTDLNEVPPISIANLIEKPYLFIQNHNNKNQVISESYIVLVQLQFQER